MYRLWEKVHGYTLVAVKKTKVYLKGKNGVEILEIFCDNGKKETGNSSSRSAYSRTSLKNISRAELQQKVLGNMDNALRGLVAGPYRENGRITGYRLKKVRSYNILYKLGARSGDIVRRINGKKLTGTKRLFNLWKNLKNESGISIDLERRRKMLSFVFKITD